MEEKLVEILEKLSASLGVATEVLWAAMIKQSYISAVSTGLGILICLFLVVCAIFIGSRERNLAKIQENYSDANGILAAMAMAVFIMAMVMVPLVDSLATQLLNPEYWALREVLSKLK